MYYIQPQKEIRTMETTGYFTNELEIAKDVAFRPYDDFHYESKLIDWCLNIFIRPDKDFVDIGAHIGTWTWRCATIANKTHAFECNRHVYNCLCANLFLKGLSYKVQTHVCGLSNRSNEEMVYYKRSKDGGGNGLTMLNTGDELVEKDCVDVFRLDDFNLVNVGFLKIDVEGHELEVLQGALMTLKKNGYPPFIFESWIAHGDDDWSKKIIKMRHDLFHFIEGLGYRIVPISGWPQQFIAEHCK